MTPKEYKQMMDYLTRSGVRKQIKFASDIARPDPKPQVQQIDAINAFMRRNPINKADGGRIGFDNGGQTFVEQAKELGISKSSFRKPYAPEIENRIIELHQNDKMGAQAIADKLTEEFDGNFSRAPVGKRIKALKAEGKIKDVPYKERKASIDQRREFYGKPRGEQYLAVREVKDIDRTTRFKDTGKLKYNIPKDAKFKVDFKNPGVSGATVSDIPEKFRGIQYYKTKKQAEKAVAERKKLKLKADVDPDEAKRSANKKKYDLVKEVSDNNIEDKLAEFKKGEPLEKAHRLSLEQVKKTGQLYNVMDLGLDFDDPKFVQINNEAVKPFENKLKQLYKEQNSLYKKSSNLKTIPNELRKQIEFNNKKISTVVDLAGGRVQGLQLDEITLKPKVYGRNYANVLGFGLYDKPVKQLTKEDRAAIGAIMQGQVDNEKRTAGKTAQKLFKNKELLKDVDKLAVQGFRPGERGSIDRQLLIDAGKGLGKAGTFAFDKVVRPLGTRAASIPLAGLTVAENIRKGENVADAVIDPLVGLELSFPGLFKENVAKITTNPTAQRILNLGRFARLTTPVGLGITAAGLGIDAAKFTRDRIKELQAMTPEQRQELRSEGARQAFDPFQAAGGGLAKQAGDRSGRPPERGPNSQGLLSLMKRGMKI
jgi:hypothetical protein